MRASFDQREVVTYHFTSTSLLSFLPSFLYGISRRRSAAADPSRRASIFNRVFDGIESGG